MSWTKRLSPTSDYVADVKERERSLNEEDDEEEDGFGSDTKRGQA